MHKFDRVGISPDGKRIAWNEAVTERRGGKNATSEAIYVADVARPSVARRISGCGAGVCDDGSFVWSADGKMLAFITTDAAGQGQMAVAAIPGGRVRRVTRTLRGPVTTPRWSPDGKSIAILYTKDGPKSPGPLNPLARDAGALGSTYFEQRLAIVPLEGGVLRLVSPADMYVYEYDWSPDGSAFALSAAHGSGDDNWWIADLYTIGARDGVLKKIHHPALQMASPRWSGDGKRIAYIGGIMSDESITGGDVYVVSAAGGEAVDVTPDLKASVTTLTWNASPSKLTVTELEGGTMSIATVDADAKTLAKRWTAEETVYANTLDGALPGDEGVSLSRDGAMSAVIRQSFTSAPEIYVGRVGAWHKITARNATTPHVITRAKNLSWTSDGFTVQGWLVYPNGFTPGRRYPMVVIVHGGPAFANYPAYPSGPDAYDAVLASQGYFVLEPNPRGSYGGGEAFTQANVKDFGGGDLRDILAGVDAAVRTAPIDERRVGIYGHSYGGYMTMWAVTQTNRFRAAVSGAGLSNWQSYYGTNNINTWMIPYFGKSVYDDPAVYAKSSPIAFIKNAKTPTLLYSGDRDAEVPVSQSYEYWNALKTFHVPTEFVVYPDEGHLFHVNANQADVAARMIRWFDRWMP
ncbi:MAG: S9 family peptidase [Candidatus Velthaea sp.]